MKLVKIKNKEKKRIARGTSGKGGKTAGRGTKGQRSRTGYNLPRFFEGGQSTIIKRLPKLKGFKSHSLKPQVVNLDRIEDKYKDGEQVNPKTLFEKGLIKEYKRPVKILGDGKLTKKVIIKDCLLSKSAAHQIEQLLNRSPKAAKVAKKLKNKQSLRLLK